jgi:lipoate-protein ligase B
MSGGVGRQRIVRILRGNAMLSSSTGTTSTGTGTTTSTLAAAPPPPVPYPLGWAWQTLLLHQRLRGKRRRREAAGAKEQQEQQENLLYNRSSSGGGVLDDDDDDDQLLVLEHEPVYTLGRGADIQHLTSLVVRQPQQRQQQPLNNNNRTTTMTTTSNSDDDDDPAVQLLRHCLTGRGAGTVRLEAPSRTVLDALLIDNDDISFQYHVNNKGEENDMTTTSMRTAMELLLQHSGTIPVLTPPPDDIPIYRVERGGEVTYHGPGQLVVYPLLDLAATRTTTSSSDYYYRPDLHWFLREMEQLLIDTITIDFGVSSTRVHRDDRYTGVWIYDDDGNGGNANHHHKRKIAAIGLTASHWITSHGFSINVHPNLAHFDHIRPCGIMMEDDKYDHDDQQRRGQRHRRRGVTSLLEELGSAKCPTMADVTECLLHNFAQRFNVQLVEEGTGWK